MELRPYQRESIDALYGHWEEGGGNGLIVIPTGGGKSLIIATLLREIMTTWPLMRIGMITHTKELIAQNYAELIKVWPQAPAGIYSAGIGRRDTRHPILFCGVQSVWNKTDLIGAFDLLLIDEAHLISRNASTMYGKFLDALKERQPDLRIVGLTATPYRLDSGRLDRGQDRLFDKIVYEANVADLIEDGYLSPLISKSTNAEISTEGVHRRGGEFIPAELEAAAMSGDLVERAAAEIVSRGAGRRAWLAFCTGVEHAVAVRDALRGRGVTAEAIDGGMPAKERDRIIQTFRHGGIRCLTSVNVLSIGFNVPHVDMVALLRPTESTGLYIQQVGRGFRKAPGKANALILDFAGNVRKHGPVDAVVTPGGAKGKGESKAKEEVRAKACPICQTLVPNRVMLCPDCGHEWVSEPKHDERPADVDILSGKSKDGWVTVGSVAYYAHRKRGVETAPPTFRVAYMVGFITVNQWWCFSHPHGSMPQRRAAGFWLEAGGNLPVPESVDEALRRQDELRPAVSIRYRMADSGFNEVYGRRYGTAAEMVA